MADDEKDPNYVTVGRIFRDDLYKETDPWAVNDDDLRPLMKCTRCGALVNGGGLSRQKHDDFHEALAGLFDSLSKIDEAIQPWELPANNSTTEKRN